MTCFGFFLSFLHISFALPTEADNATAMSDYLWSLRWVFFAVLIILLKGKKIMNRVRRGIKGMPFMESFEKRSIDLSVITTFTPTTLDCCAKCFSIA